MLNYCEQTNVSLPGKGIPKYPCTKDTSGCFGLSLSLPRVSPPFSKSGLPGDAALGKLIRQLPLPPQHRQECLKQKAYHQDLQRQVQGVFHGTGGHIIQVSLAVENSAPQRAQKNILDVGEELCQDDAAPGDPGPIEKQGIDYAAQNSGEHIAGKVGIAPGGEKKAESILRCTEQDHHHRAAYQGAQGSGQEGDADGQPLPHPDGTVAEDDAGGDHQCRKHYRAVVFYLQSCSAPVGAGKWGLKNGHKNPPLHHRQSGNAGSAAQRSRAAQSRRAERYAAAGCGKRNAGDPVAFPPTDNSPFRRHLNMRLPTLPDVDGDSIRLLAGICKRIQHKKGGGYGQPAPRWARDTMGWDDVAHRSLWVRRLEVVERAAARVTPTARMMGAKKQPSG